MTRLPIHLLIGLILLAVVAGVRVLTANRTIHRRLLLTGILTLAYLALGLALSRGAPGPEVAGQLRSIAQLLLALALTVLVVTLVINPHRDDRVPDRFPTIVQDAIIISVFALVATVVLQEKFLTTSAVGAVVVGFALQDTLGNAFAGLAIQVEKPFHVGDWISVAQFEGRVSEVTWRATKLKTKAGNFVVVPNNVIAKEAIVNYSEPVPQTMLAVEVGTTYDCPPNRVKDVLGEAVRRVPLVLASPAPEVLLERFDASAITYQVRFWTADFGVDARARDQVRTAVYYALHRAGIEIPYPIQVEMPREFPAGDSPERHAAIAAVFADVPVFRPLPPGVRDELARTAQERLFGAGEVIVRQGDEGGSMFVIRSGRVAVTLEPSKQQIATTTAGGYFGEMSLLTGDPRTATVTAVVDSVVLEITAETFRTVIYPHPEVIELVGAVAVKRREELEQSRAAVPAPTQGAGADAGFLDRVKRFLRLPSW